MRAFQAYAHVPRVVSKVLGFRTRRLRPPDALTAQRDRFTPANWDGLLGSHDLSGIEVTDFEVLDLGTPIPYTGDCEREP
jgi:hypothetical protein